MSRDYTLEQEYENAKARLTEQRETLQSFSNEGQRMVRIILFSGSVVVATVGAFGFESLMAFSQSLFSGCAVDFGGTCYVRAMTLAGYTGFFLFFSAFAHAHSSGLEARGIHNLANPSDIYKCGLNPREKEDYLQERLRVYIERIDHNDRIIHTFETFLALGKLGLVFAFFGVGILLYVAYTGGPINMVVLLGPFLAYLGFLYVQNRVLPSNYLRADRTFSLRGYTPIYDTDYLAVLDDVNPKEGDELPGPPTSTPPSDEGQD